MQLIDLEKGFQISVPTEIWAEICAANLQDDFRRLAYGRMIDGIADDVFGPQEGNLSDAFIELSFPDRCQGYRLVDTGQGVRVKLARDSD